MRSERLVVVLVLSLLLGAAIMAETKNAGPTELSGVPWDPDKLQNHEKVIYGTDDRVDVYEETDPFHLQLVNSTCALIDSGQIIDNGDDTYSVVTYEYQIGGYEPCSGEPFADQPTAAFCSGFRVGDDLIATAGHCIETDADAQNTCFVFGFQMLDATTPVLQFDASQIYWGTEVVVQQLLYNNCDYAIIRVDRPITAPDAEILEIRRSGTVPLNTQVGVIGHPSGLPTKIAFGSATKVYENHQEAYFVSNLDTYGGNSGSAVFNATTGVVEGILVRGSADFVFTTCFSSNELSDEEAGEEVSKTTTFAQFIPSGTADQVIYSATMDTDPGWTFEGQWAWGEPTGGGGEYGNADPTSGYTGSNVTGFNLNGDYPNELGVIRWATTPVIDCSAYTNVTLSFYRWLGVEDSLYDRAPIEVTNDGVTWDPVWMNSGSTALSDGSWRLCEYNLSAWADEEETVQVRWGMGPTDSSWRYCGWNIDDVSLRGSGGALIPVPDVIDMSQSEAETAIVDAGLAVGVISTQYSNEVPVDDVIDQTPAPSTEVTLGSEVDLVVSLGPDERLTVSFDTQGGTAADPSSIMVVCGDAYGALPTTTREGHVFNGWFTAASGGNEVTASTPVTNCDDHTLYAQWTIKTYTLTYSAGPNGTVEGDLEQTVDHGADGTPVEAVPNDGYYFVQWSDGSTQNPRTDVNVTADLSVTAEFTENAYTVVFDAQGGPTPSPPSMSVTYGSAYGTLPAMSREGYTFNGWFTAASGGTQITASTLVTTANDHTLYAQWTVTVYTLTYSAGANGTVDGDLEQTVEYGSDGFTVQAVADEGYHFAQWSDGATENPRTDVNVTADLSVTAQFAANTYTVTFEAESGPTPSPSSMSVTYGSAYGTLPAMSREGYTFNGWFTAADGGTRITASTFVTTAGDHTLYAQWTITAYMLTYSAGANGAIEGELEQSVEYGSDGTPVEAIPDEGYRFERWSDGSTENPRTDTNVTQDVLVTAGFISKVGGLQVIIAPLEAIDDGARWRWVSSVVTKSETEMTSGNVFRVGEPVFTDGVLEVPLVLFRGEDAIAADVVDENGRFVSGPAPAEFGFDVVYDPSVLALRKEVEGQPGITPSDDLRTWYGHEVTVTESDGADGGRVRLEFTDSASGRSVTTRDNVRESGEPGNGENPFPLATLYFDCSSVAEASTSLLIQNIVATDGEQRLAAVTAQSMGFKLNAGSDWFESGHTETDVPTGTCTVEFLDVSGWTAPESRQVEVVSSEMQRITGTYTSGSLEVLIEPEGARNAGAMWRRVGTDEWHGSGFTEEVLALGSHDIEFLDVDGWITPPVQTASIRNGELTTATGTYELPTGSLQVTITPREAVDAGVKWRVGDGAWQESGATVSDLPVGTYEVTCNEVEEWRQPDPEEVSIQANETATLTITCKKTLGWTGLQTLETKVAEEVLPLSIEGAGKAQEAQWDSFAIRLSADSAIDPVTVWGVAEINGIETAAEAVWRPVAPDDGTDGWVLVRVSEPLAVGETLVVTVGALTVEGAEVPPVTEQFQIDGEKDFYDVAEAPYLTEDGTVEPLPEILASEASEVYRIVPSGVFEEPLVIWIPVPEGASPQDVGIYYFSDSERHHGWYRAENVLGWMVPGSRTVVEEDGRLYIQLEVNHSGVLQLGQAVNVQLGNVMAVNVGADGSSAQWIAVVAILLLLLALFAIARKRSQEAD